MKKYGEKQQYIYKTEEEKGRFCVKEKKRAVNEEVDRLKMKREE